MSQRRSIVILSHACNRAVNRAPYAELERLGWRVLVVTAEALIDGGRRVSADPAEIDGPATTMLPLRGRHARLQRYDGLRALLQKEQPDWLVADIDPHSWLAVELALLKSRLKYRLGFISCENLPFGPLQLARRRGWRGLLLGMGCSVARMLVRPRTDLVFCINSTGKRLFTEAGFQRVETTPLGFPQRHFRVNPEARTRIRARLNLTGPAIAYFGRLTPEKGVHVLLDALDQLADQTWHLLLDDFQPNTGYQMQLRRRVESAAWAARAHLIEAKHGEVADYMNAADLVVVPSLSTANWIEQYGRVVPEALACGCRVIASRSGALPELLSKHGRLVEEGDAAGLARAIADELEALRIDANRQMQAADYALECLSARAQAQLWDHALTLASASAMQPS